MLATELALKGIPVRVNSIAPGVYESEMTFDTITGPEEMARVAQSLFPVPAGRPGSCVHPHCPNFFIHRTPGLARLLAPSFICHPQQDAIPMAKRSWWMEVILLSILRLPDILQSLLFLGWLRVGMSM